MVNSLLIDVEWADEVTEKACYTLTWSSLMVSLFTCADSVLGSADMMCGLGKELDSVLNNTCRSAYKFISCSNGEWQVGGGVNCERLRGSLCHPK